MRFGDVVLGGEQEELKLSMGDVSRKEVRSGGWAGEVESLLRVTQGTMSGQKQGESGKRTKALLMVGVITISLCLLPDLASVGKGVHVRRGCFPDFCLFIPWAIARWTSWEELLPTPKSTLLQLTFA